MCATCWLPFGMGQRIVKCCALIPSRRGLVHGSILMLPCCCDTVSCYVAHYASKHCSPRSQNSCMPALVADSDDDADDASISNDLVNSFFI